MKTMRCEERRKCIAVDCGLVPMSSWRLSAASSLCFGKKKKEEIEKREKGQ